MAAFPSQDSNKKIGSIKFANSNDLGYCTSAKFKGLKCRCFHRYQQASHKYYQTRDSQNKTTFVEFANISCSKFFTSIGNCFMSHTQVPIPAVTETFVMSISLARIFVIM